MFRGTGHHGHAETQKFICAHIVLRDVALVRDNRARHTALAHPLENLLVKRSDTRTGIHHHQAHCGIRDCERCLLARLGGQRVITSRRLVKRETTRIDQHEALPVRLDFPSDTVTRHARLVKNDRDALTRDAVEKSALAHVGTPDDRDDAARLVDIDFVHNPVTFDPLNLAP